MTRTALEILNAAEDELGLDNSSSFASTDVATRQRRAFVNATLEEIVRYGDYSSLEREAVIQFLGPTVVSATLTDDSATITVADSSPFAAAPTAWTVTGESIQTGTRILSVTDGTTIVLDKWANASGAEDLTFIKDTFALPDDMAYWLPQTHWDSRFMWALIGPTNSQFDAWQRNGIVGPYPRRQFRKQGPRPTAFRIFPPPSSSGDYPGTLTFRYITENAVEDENGATKRLFTANTDVPLIDDDRLIILGTKWRWQQAKGFDYGPLQEEYYNWLDGSTVIDKGETVLAVDGGDAGENWLDQFHVQDGSFPG
jgi:hypothetical protein